jgi:hypothetical protein
MRQDRYANPKYLKTTFNKRRWQYEYMRERGQGLNTHPYLAFTVEKRHGFLDAINVAKYTQHKDARDALLATGHKYLVEASPDTTWGTGVTVGDWRKLQRGPEVENFGENRMGRILMRIRKLLQKQLLPLQ